MPRPKRTTRPQGVKSKLFPKCDGAEWKNSDPRDRTAAAKLEFLTAYHRINTRYQKLLSEKRRHEKKSAAGQCQILVQHLEEAILIKERIEDKYYPAGIIAHPITDNGITVNLEFTSPVTRLRPLQQQASSSSATYVVAWPPSRARGA